MRTIPAGPSPSEFYEAFFAEASKKESDLLRLWNDPTEYTRFIRSTIFPAVASALDLTCYPFDYYTLDSIFYKERDTDNFSSRWTYAKFISVALEHENNCEGPTVCGSTKEEINKLQLFNTPLKVLITYPPGNDGDALLKKYAEIINAADIFEDISRCRRQLVIFGWTDAAANLTWKGYEYSDGDFREISPELPSGGPFSWEPSSL